MMLEPESLATAGVGCRGTSGIKPYNLGASGTVLSLAPGRRVTASRPVKPATGGAPAAGTCG
jgi:hypothetical protein